MAGESNVDHSAQPGAAPAPRRIVRLGEHDYEIGSGQIIKLDGTAKYLRAQSASVLDILALNLGQLVTKDELLQQVWSGIAVTDASVTQCIRDIRLAIGDRDRSILLTVPKQGFRLFGSALVPAKPAAPSGARPVPPATVATKIASPERPLPIVPQLDPRDVMPTIAVLPFKGMNEGNALDVFGFFLADEIAQQLGHGRDVNVISRLSTGTMGGDPVSFDNVQSKLNADFLLSGVMVHGGDQVAVSLEFSETETGYVLWSDRVQLPYDPTSVKVDGVDLIVAHLRQSIMANEVHRIHARPIADLKLFSILHGAVGLMHRLSPEDFKRAKSYLDLLHEMVPHHPAPLAWMARWHSLRSVQGWSEDPLREAQTALDRTARALDQDPNNTLALVCEGQVLVHLKRDLEGAEARYNQALEQNPNDANGRSLRGMLHGFTDRGDMATRDTERALHLTPLDPHRFMYLALAAGANIASENYDRAVILAKESLRLNRSHLSTLRMLAVAQLGSGDEEAGRQTMHDLLARQPDLRVSDWLKNAPSADFKNGQRFAAMMRQVGVPE